MRCWCCCGLVSLLLAAGVLALGRSAMAGPPALTLDAVLPLTYEAGLRSPEETPPPRPLAENPLAGLQMSLPPAQESGEPGQFLQGPVCSEGKVPARIAPGQVQEGDRPLPINLATALHLADARPLIIAAAQASTQLAAARLSQARALWLPNFVIGGTWYRHDGGGTGNSGLEYIVGRDQYMIGAGPFSVLAFADAIFLVRAAREDLQGRQAEVQAARNDALLEVTRAYFNVQQARGTLGGALDTVEKGKALERRIQALSTDLVPPIEIDRALTELARLKRDAAESYEEWRVASGDLTRELRLNPAAVVGPLEPPHLQVTLISPRECVDELIPIGLTSRPELAAHQAFVQATLERVRLEKARPWVPSLILAPNAVPAAPYTAIPFTPYGSLMGGLFASDLNGKPQPWVGRFDLSAMLVWEFRNMGFGNRALVRQRSADRQRELIQLFRTQDEVAAEVFQAHARVQASTRAVAAAETEVRTALSSYEGNFKALGETARFGDQLAPMVRPWEAVIALRRLRTAYDQYYASVADYNRAQFELYHALGYPAGILACERNPEDRILDVDTTRPSLMAPVDAPPPCRRCGP